MELSARSFAEVTADFNSIWEEEKDSDLPFRFDWVETAGSASLCVIGEGAWLEIAAAEVVRKSDLVEAASIELSLFDVSLAIPKAEIPAALAPIGAGFPTATESACSMRS